VLAPAAATGAATFDSKTPKAVTSIGKTDRERTFGKMSGIVIRDS
jgi:phage terminase large subunit-like protein